MTDLNCSPSKLETGKTTGRNMLCAASNGSFHDEVLVIFRKADAVSLALLRLQTKKPNNRLRSEYHAESHTTVTWTIDLLLVSIITEWSVRKDVKSRLLRHRQSV